MLYIFTGYFIPCSFEVHWQLTSSKVVFSYIIWINGHTFNLIITGLIWSFGMNEFEPSVVFLLPAVMFWQDQHFLEKWKLFFFRFKNADLRSLTDCCTELLFQRRFCFLLLTNCKLALTVITLERLIYRQITVTLVSFLICIYAA